MPRSPRPRLPLFTGQAPSRVVAPVPKEHVLHITVARLLDRYLADGWEYTHCPAGELRTLKTAAKLKAMGVKPGWPDLILVSPEGIFHGLELKRTGRGRLSENQEAFHARAAGRGWKVTVVDSYEAALAVLSAWGALRIQMSAV